MKVTIHDWEIDLGPKPSRLCRRRWLGELSPEPETVEWIEGLTPDKIFYDIGASLGTHAIRACVRGLQVTAFEPANELFNELQEICTRNLLPIVVSNCALSNSVGTGRLRGGRSSATFYADQAAGQIVESTTLDMWCTGRRAPDYIKLDVDGNEEQIIRGGEKTFKKVESALIEVDPVVCPNIPKMMAELGFTYDPKQVASNMIQSGKYKGMANYIFWRE
jgi:FkbM family methyltransferase